LFNITDTGEISFETFLECAAPRLRSGDEEISVVKEAFKVFDKDGSGCLSKEEAKAILQRGGNSISDEEVDEFFSSVDLNADGKIDLGGMYIYIIQFIRYQF
jgi:Ca2+-binding EF-hand superfamily protein